MKTTSSKAALAASAALLLCTVFGAARAQELYEPTDTPGALVLIPPSVGNGERDEQDAARALDERRQKMMVDCEQNNGVDCEREVDTELRAEGLQRGARVIHLRPSR